MNSKVFQPAQILNMQLKNRFVRSATFEGMANFEGRPTNKLKDLYLDLADGGVGLIVTGLTHVDGYKGLPDMEGVPFPLAMDEDRFVDDWIQITESVHQCGSKIAMQLNHLGGQDIPQLREPVAPSAISIGNGVVPRELTIDEIHVLIEKFVQSCRRAKDAGFDAVQLHGGHGFLISSFISPLFNTRNDLYGGSTENRARFIVEILKKVRKSVGSEFPLLIKMNFDDCVAGGLKREEAVKTARILIEAGIDAIEVTGGISSGDPQYESSTQKIKGEKDEAYFLSYAIALKKQVSIPVISVGGFRSLNTIEKIISDGDIDFVSMSRPFICEPGIIRRWNDGNRQKAKCISCNKCRENMANEPLKCYI